MVFSSKKDRTWVKWVHGYYVKRQDVFTMPIPAQTSWVVKKIIAARETVTQGDEGQQMKSSSFSIKRLYLGLRGQFLRVEWHKLICNNVAPPKCIFIIWLAMLGKLFTCDNPGKVGIHVDPICNMCSREVESGNHLFFLCDFSSVVWDGVAEWSGANRVAGDWEMVEHTFLAHCGSSTGKQKLYRLVLSIVVYQIWKERSKRKFLELMSSIDDVVRVCKFQIVICYARDTKLARFLPSL